MRKTIQQYVEHEKACDDFRQEALDSWDAYQETGRHLTGPEVEEWLQSWGTMEEKIAPECHE